MSYKQYTLDWFKIVWKIKHIRNICDQAPKIFQIEQSPRKVMNMNICTSITEQSHRYCLTIIQIDSLAARHMIRFRWIMIHEAWASLTQYKLLCLSTDYRNTYCIWTYLIHMHAVQYYQIFINLTFNATFSTGEKLPLWVKCILGAQIVYTANFFNLTISCRKVSTIKQRIILIFNLYLFSSRNFL